jgi:1-phosphofructokinase family hexose kinase
VIYTVTLNPAIDRILFLDEINKGRTNRIKRSVETLGGKGTHVSINLKLLGIQNTALGITFGKNGKKITKLMESWGVDTRFLHYQQEGMDSRTNYILVEETGHHCTMVTERGPILSTKITADLLAQMKNLLQEGDMLVLTGDASNVVDATIYTQLTLEAKKKGVKVFLDSSGPYLMEGLKSQPFLIKPNFEEMCYLAGKELSTEQDVVKAMESLENCGIEMIVMTWSGNGAIVKNGKDIYRVNPVKVNVINEVGCGDAFLSAIIAGLEKSEDIEEILKSAAAVAGAASECEITTGFDQTRAEELKKQAKITKLR